MDTEKQLMKCKDLAKELNVTAMHIGRIRSKLWSGSKGDLTDEQVLVIRATFDEMESIENRTEIEEAVKPKIISAFCTYAREGSRRIDCKLVDTKKPVVVLLPLGLKGETLRKKTFDVEEVEYEGKYYYRHASLAGRAWQGVTNRKT